MWLSKNPRQEISRQIFDAGILTCCYKQHKNTKWLTNKPTNNAEKPYRTSYLLKFVSQRVRFSRISCNMAFFNLTQLGVQDPIRAALRDDKSAAENDGRNGTVNVNLTAQQEGGCKSYVKYTERLTKHQRSPKGKYY